MPYVNLPSSDGALTKYPEINKIWAYLQHPNLIKYQIVVYGGFLRDSILGKPVKDVDVTCQYHDWYNIKRSIFHGLDTWVDRDEDVMKSDYNHRYINDVVEGPGPEGYVWNAIQWRESGPEVTKENVAHNCDLGTSRISMDRHGLYISDEFVSGVRDHTHVIYRTTWGLDGVRAHCARIAEKYPDWKFDTKDDPRHVTPQNIFDQGSGFDE